MVVESPTNGNPHHGNRSDCPNSPHLAAFGQCRCQCTFLDVGANDGDTLLTWIGEFLKPGSPYHKQLPQKLKRTLQSCFTSQRNLCFYGIEGNPRFTTQLQKLHKLLTEEGFHAKLYTDTVLGLEDGFVTMFVEPGIRGMDSSLLAGKKTHYFAPKKGATATQKGSNLGNWVSSNSPISETFRHVRVTSIGAARFLTSLQRHSDFVGMKLDVEGYEYTLFRRLLVTAPQVLCNLNLAHVDWHEHYLTNASDTPAVATSSGTVRQTLEWLLTSDACGVHWPKGSTGPPDAGTLGYLERRTGTALVATNGFGLNLWQDAREYMPVDLAPTRLNRPARGR